jgi:hypothetical protein
MDSDGIIVGIVIWLFIGIMVGIAIGDGRGRAGEGAVLGALLGPIGWFIVAVLPYSYTRKCPACFGGVPEGATVCKNCGRDLPPPEVESSLRRKGEWSWPKRELPAAQPGVESGPAPPLKARVACPVCGFRAEVEHEQLSEGVKCQKCGVGFVPTASKHKH